MIIVNERQSPRFDPFLTTADATAPIAGRPGLARAGIANPDASEEYYAFASFRLYPRRRSLLRNDELVEIGGRAFDLLHLLASRAGSVISSAELMSVVWANLAVEEGNLRVQMGSLRKILSQCEAAQRAIETIPLRGYCFVLSVKHHPQGTRTEDFGSHRDNKLPTLLNLVIGRDEAIETITSALEERQLVTITGPGGVGKTTVAIATANHFAGSFRGTIGFVDLSSASDTGGVASMIAKALGLEVECGTVEDLCDHLSVHRSLLILDTCEHIVEPVATLAEELLARCKDLTLLVTSREALRAEGEWIYRLPSLTVAAEGEQIDERNFSKYSAMAMFIDRVGFATRFEPRRDDFPVIAEICRRLDGIPLALEFAAARVADVGLRKIAANLDRRLSILTRGRRTALPRHQTLSAAIEWSYGLLSADEQLMLRHFATIDGSFTAEVAVAVGRVAGCEHSLQALGGLYEKSLLTVDTKGDESTYRLLDTVRVYMAGKLAN
jgi:predicted ATPase/DNA-binding winged helix-turn-helix (wHTH) protein